MAGILGDYLPAQDAPVDTQATRPQFELSDFLRSLGSGLQNGVSGIAGLPGDLRNMATGGVSDVYGYLAGQLGTSPERIAQVQRDAAAFMQRQPTLFPYLPTYSGMGAQMQSAFGPPHQPQTQAGNFAYRLGQNLPGLPFGLAALDDPSNGNHAGSPNSAVPDRMRY